MEEVADQGAKISVMRKYDQTVDMLRSARSAADGARRIIGENREKFRLETHKILKESNLVTHNMTIRVKASVDVGSVLARIDSLKLMITRAEDLLNVGNIIEARRLALKVHNEEYTVSREAERLLERQ